MGDREAMLSAEPMKSLPDVFRTLTDPRSRYGRRYRLETLLGACAAEQFWAHCHTTCSVNGDAITLYIVSRIFYGAGS